MGKLTDSLKGATQKMSDLKHGIHEMQQLGRDLADNTLEVADAALRTGYAYAKAESGKTGEKTERLLDLNPKMLDADQLNQTTCWTQKLLEARFGSFNAAYQYLRDVHNIRVKQRSWKKLVDIFNGNLDARSPEQRLASLEQLFSKQEQRINELETKLIELIQSLGQAL
ncbi:MAG: hypothetical protein DCF22_00265 [Leptolyngbya sp.]|nr:MAG: hypothetical protein DCF22_00265 [Leptolyngbya sp.]